MARLMSRDEYRKLVAKKRPKYGNQKSYGYDSKFEASVASELTKYERADKISNLKTQQKYPIEVFLPSGEWVQLGQRYIRVDFIFKLGNKTVLLDAKGFSDKAQMLKYQLFETYLPDRYPSYIFKLLYYRSGWENELTKLILG